MTETPKLNLNKAQERFIDRVLKSLNNEHIPWVKSWDPGNDIPYNFSSKKPYQGLNQLLLWMEQETLNTSDNRWMTFNQAKEKGYRVKKGSKGTPIQFFQLYNKRTKKEWDKSYYQSLSPEEQAKEQEYLKIVARTYTVFNGSQLEGLPPLSINTQISSEQRIKNAEDYLQNLQKNMGVPIIQGQNRAFYELTQDIVNMPPFEAFIAPDNYYHTALHEFAHATQHPTRLNRDNKRASFGSYNYSVEELRAEISAFFQSMELGLDATSLEINTVSYCQGWAEVIQKDPTVILMAVRDAVKIKEYMVEKGELEKILESNQILETSTATQNDQGPNENAPSKDLEISVDTLRSSVLITDYAVDVLGFGLRDAGNGKMQIVEHDSCFIYTNKNDFYRFSSHAGGDIYNFVQEFEEVDFKTALERVKAYYYEYEPMLVEGSTYKMDLPSSRTLELPPTGKNNDKLIHYLHEKRGINKIIIQDILDRNLMYQDKRNNIVFVGYDKNMPLFGTRRSTFSDFKGDVKGTQKNVGFYIDNKSDTLVLAEGPIDALSLLELYEAENKTVNVLATGGVGNALACWKWNIENRNFSNIKNVVIAFDSDEPGMETAEMLEDYISHYYNTLNLKQKLPLHKDFNQDLMAKKGIEFEASPKEKSIEKHIEIEPILKKQKDNYVRGIINDRYCKRTYKNVERNQTFRIMEFPKGSQYYGYSYFVPTSFFKVHNFRSQEMILEVKETYDFKLQKGHYDKTAKKYIVDDEKIVKASDLLKGYQDLEYESESKQYVRLSKRDLDYFKAVVKQNNETAQKDLLEDVDAILHDKNTWLVERHKIMDLQEKVLTLANEEILETIEELEKDQQERVNKTWEKDKTQVSIHSIKEQDALDLNEMELEM